MNRSLIVALTLWASVAACTHTSQHRAPASADFAATGAGVFEIYVNPPASDQDWSTPRKLLATEIKSLISTKQIQIRKEQREHKAALGHVLMRLACTGTRGSIDEASGFTGENSFQGPKLLFLKGAGLGVLLHRFDDGEIQSHEFVSNYIHDLEHERKPRVRKITVPLNTVQCDRMMDHLATFRAQKQLEYGFLPDPLKYEGAGCGNYVSSFLTAAGIDEALFTRWIRHVKFSSRYVGTKTLQTDKGLQVLDPKQPKRVGLLALLRPFRKSTWEFKDTNNYEFDFVDPQLMRNFVDEVLACAHEPNSCKDAEISAFVQKHSVRADLGSRGSAIELQQGFVSEALPTQE